MDPATLIKYFVIVLLMCITLDIIFIFAKLAYQTNENKKKIDKCLFDKYKKKFKCVSKSHEFCVYEDEVDNYFTASIFSGKFNDNKSFSRIAGEIKNNYLSFDMANTTSSCRILSFNEYDDMTNFSIENLLRLKSGFLVQLLFVVSTKCEDESELQDIINEIDKKIKDFPFRIFSRSVIFVHPANAAYGKQFALSYPLSDGDLSSFNCHSILIDTKEF